MAQKRFERIYNQGAVTTTEIFVDRETGVHYLFHTSGYAGGLTPLLDKDGKVVVSPVDDSIF
ncbi:DUF6440 family protein [Streptococcus dentiloxodontae]